MTQFNILDAGGPHRFKVSTEGAGGGWALSLELKLLEHMRDTLMPGYVFNTQHCICMHHCHCHQTHPVVVSEPIINVCNMDHDRLRTRPVHCIWKICNPPPPYDKDKGDFV